MIKYDVISSLSERKALRKLEEKVNEDWEIEKIMRNWLFMFGCGGASGLTIIIKRDEESKET